MTAFAAREIQHHLPRRTMAAAAADRLRQAILRGDYELGARLKEADLNCHYGVTSIVIREAFHRLEAEGLVVTAPYRGRSVFTITPEEFPEMLLMRASLEAQAAFWAARRMNDSVRCQLRTALERMQKVSTAVYEDIINLELDFHRTVWEAALSSWLSRQLGQLVLPLLALPSQKMIGPFGSVEEESAHIRDVEQSGQEGTHTKLTDALLRGDAPEARDCMVRHILRGSVAIEELRGNFFGY